MSAIESGQSTCDHWQSAAHCCPTQYTRVHWEFYLRCWIYSWCASRFELWPPEQNQKHYSLWPVVFSSHTAWQVKWLSRFFFYSWQASPSFAMWQGCMGTRSLAESWSSTSCSTCAESTRGATSASYDWSPRRESTSCPPWTLTDTKQRMRRWVMV